MTRAVVRFVIGVAVLAGVMVPASPAAAASGCSRTANHAGYVTYNCYMFKPVVHVWDMWQDSTVLQLYGNSDGLLYRGTSWFVCQRAFGVTIQDGSVKNNYWAYTLSDNNYWGWVSAAYISGGANMAPVPGLAGCPSGFGASASRPHDPGNHSGVFTTPIDYASITSFDAPIVRVF